MNGGAPQAVLSTMHAVFLARALYVVADLGIADLLADRPQSSDELAEKLGVAPIPLRQVLRAVAGTGLLRSDDQRYSLTETGQTLQSGHPTGTRDMVLTMQGPMFWDSLAVLPERVATGRTGPEIAYGAPFFDVLSRDPDAVTSFNRMMIATQGDEPTAVAEAYDLSWAERVVDVGGGVGTRLIAMLQRNPELSGVVFDRPDVVEDARAHIEASGMADRCTVVGGDFLEAVPAGADAYVLSRILHDWDDETCLRILRRCTEAMKPGSRLLIVEKILPDGDEPHLSRLLDLIMLTVTGGRERTAAEYRELLAQAGLTVRRVLATSTAASVIECV
ncbi:methyltransferase [Lentzea sp. NBRC 105346]|uniref:methyltransferase n=1 Tax=Lentzea sp. NBRC 105346 TaxID=3032205 RepID=UPI0024A5B981|nr:methyltransferase [Lentzea sp. NBRC 105346]GLZ29585.1 methyltransferase [Lentzea sp. NBRC 105346]